MFGACHNTVEFQSTPSGGKATVVDVARAYGWVVSIHAFRGEGDSVCSARVTTRYSFNPRLPGGRRRNRRSPSPSPLPVSIHAFRGEGDFHRMRDSGFKRIVSIHAFRGEGDYCRSIPIRRMLGFNPRLPGGRRLALRRIFQTAEPVSIHAFRGEGDSIPFFNKRRGCVSIHAFRGEGDRGVPGIIKMSGCFNPRLPGGRRPGRTYYVYRTEEVSIHAFRGEGDPSRA